MQAVLRSRRALSETHRRLVERAREARLKSEGCVGQSVEIKARIDRLLQEVAQRASTRPRERIRWKLRIGLLPYDSVPIICGAPGSGGPCAACDTTLQPTQLVMAVPLPRAKTFVFLHADCFMLWDCERRLTQNA